MQRMSFSRKRILSDTKNTADFWATAVALFILIFSPFSPGKKRSNIGGDCRKYGEGENGNE